LFLFSFLFSTVNCACCSRSHPYPRRPEPASIYQKASNVILLHS
jgi:hypothetical protein